MAHGSHWGIKEEPEGEAQPKREGVQRNERESERAGEREREREEKEKERSRYKVKMKMKKDQQQHKITRWRKRGSRERWLGEAVINQQIA